MQKARSASKKKAIPVPIVAPEPPAMLSIIVDEKKKRGRKKTTDSQATLAQPTQPTLTQPTQPTLDVDVMIIPPKKKRVNKKKEVSATAEEVSVELEPEEPEAEAEAAVEAEPAPESPDSGTSATTAHKKRGRKPKGGKVIQQLVHEAVSLNDAPNIILHLKCSVSDIPTLNATLTETTIKPGDVISFNALENKGADLNDSYQSNVTSAGNFIINAASNHNKPRSTPDALIATNSYNHLNDDADCIGADDDDDDASGSSDKNLKEIWKKLNHLKLCFHKSDVFQNIGAGTRRSCCFWDTCEFDTPPIYIPKCIAANGGYTVYGCFCSPECALAYLMNEGVDTSVKFERCQMLNSMYGRLLNYEKSIKPAPNPQYILSKFYGNLSIQEYRKLFKSEQIIYVVNKPLTHILPEMYEDNNDFLLNNKVIPNNTYKLKKKTSVFG